MCEGSIHVANRSATEKEELVLRTIPDYGMKGFYPVRGRRLVCTLPNTKAMMDEVCLVNGAYASPYGNGAGSKAFETAVKWNKARDVEVKLVSLRSLRSGDAIVMPDGSIFPLAYFRDGTRIGIGRVKKVDLDKALALDQIRADVPREDVPREVDRLTDAFTAEEKAEYDDYIREFARDEAAEKF